MLRYCFEDYLQSANRADTPEQLFDIFTASMSKFGYDKCLFGLLTNHNDIGLKAGVGVIENYPVDWMRYYFDHKFDRVDPIVTYGAHQPGAFLWKEIPDRVALKPIQKKCLSLGIEAGLHNGMSVPLRGKNSQMAGISLATSEKNDACHFDPDLITAYCHHFYVAYKRLHKKQSAVPQNIVLTEKEREVLTWAASGKTDEEIGEILSMSKHTVNLHFRHIFEKIGANNRILAVVKALTVGIISP